MPVITRRFEWDSGHRVLRHESKCRHLHGHRYVAEISIRSPDLDPLGRVVDFGVVKQVIGRWIDDHWDHNMLLNSEDPLCHFVCEVEHDRQAYLFLRRNPTAEVIAEELFRKSQVLLVGHVDLEVVRVRIFETPNCWADYNGVE